MSDDKRDLDSDPVSGAANGWFDEMRQRLHSVFCQMSMPDKPLDDEALEWTQPPAATAPPAAPAAGAPAATSKAIVGPSLSARRATLHADAVLLHKTVAELANCVWYLKTKFFKREWESQDIADDDPRVRRALGRLNRGLQALKDGGFDVQDWTNRRYPQGGGDMLKPIQFQPTEGLQQERVSEMVVPLIYRHEYRVQLGEVFVAVPMAEVPGAAGAPSGVSTPGDEDPPVGASAAQ